MKKIGLVGLCLAVLAGNSLAEQNLDPKVLDLLQQVIQQVKSGELSQAHLEALVKHQNPFEKKSATAKQPADGAVRIFVDYTRPLAEMIKACGFDWANADITTKHFPINRRPNGEVEMKVYRFNRFIESDEVIREMDKEGYRPAELPEGLAYAKANLDEQRMYPIVILGSVWRNFLDYWRVTYLPSDGVRRYLDDHWFDSGFGSSYRFLAVRK